VGGGVAALVMWCQVPRAGDVGMASNGLVLLSTPACLIQHFSVASSLYLPPTPHGVRQGNLLKRPPVHKSKPCTVGTAPGRYSSVRTRLLQYCQCTTGTRTQSVPRKLRRNLRNAPRPGIVHTWQVCAE
jgi:hypothetical protein